MGYPVPDPGGGGRGKGAMANLACKNRLKEDGRQTRQLIFHVSCPPPLSEVSGPATGIGLKYK